MDDYLKGFINDPFFSEYLNPSLLKSGGTDSHLPDMYGCDYLFQMRFIKPEMEYEFYDICADFLIKELHNIHTYSKLDYYFARTDLQSTDQIYFAHVLSFMVNAYRSGSEYAKNILFSLYKKYYKKEYNQLKRFSSLSFNELTGLVEKLPPPDEARILFFAELMGIRRDPEIDLIYHVFNKVAEIGERVFEDSAAKNSELKKNVLSGRDDAKKALEVLFPDREKMFGRDKKFIKATDQILRFYDYSKDLLDFSDEEVLGYDDTMEIAYLLLRKCLPAEEITGDLILLYAELMHAVGAAGSNKNRLSYLLGEFPYLTENSEKEEEIVKQEQSNNAPVEEPETNLEISELLSMIRELRIKLHEKESEVKQVRSELAGSKEDKKELQALKELYKDAQSELATLRSFAYELTQEDLPQSGTSLDEMKRFLREKRIVIVGGHSNWSSKIKNLFPNWLIIKPSPSGAVETTPVENADYVYFFTDIISHSTYARYINVLRLKRIPYGYLHGVNVEENIRYIYKQLEELER